MARSGEQNPEGVLVIRVPEPEMIGSHSHLEMLHETNIRSVSREPSQTEKGTANHQIARRRLVRVLWS